MKKAKCKVCENELELTKTIIGQRKSSISHYVSKQGVYICKGWICNRCMNMINEITKLKEDKNGQCFNEI